MIEINKFLGACAVLLVLSFSSAAWSKPLVVNGFDLSNSMVPQKAIVHGGPARDGIPAIHAPHYVSVGEATFLKDDDFVLGIVVKGKAFAYPRYILTYHELVNGEEGGEPFLISYCPLCGTGMAFSSRVKGKTLTFGVSGLLFNSDVIFYDHQTESLWSQIDRTSISGPMVGTELVQLPLTHTHWQDWKTRHPNSLVLSEQQGIKRNYRHDPYSGYETSSRLFFKTLREAPKTFHTKERVLGIELNGKSKAYPFSVLRKHGKASFEDEVAGQRLTVLWNAKHETASITSEDGKEMVSTIAYWFAWYAFHPETTVFKP